MTLAWLLYDLGMAAWMSPDIEKPDQVTAAQAPPGRGSGASIRAYGAASA